MDELCLKPATELARLVRTREVSAVELLDTHLARIDACNPDLNAIVTLVPERARALAGRRSLDGGRGGRRGRRRGRARPRGRARRHEAAAVGLRAAAARARAARAGAAVAAQT